MTNRRHRCVKRTWKDPSDSNGARPSHTTGPLGPYRDERRPPDRTPGVAPSRIGTVSRNVNRTNVRVPSARAACSAREQAARTRPNPTAACTDEVGPELPQARTDAGFGSPKR
jgi:hypothetical protein